MFFLTLGFESLTTIYSKIKMVALTRSTTLFILAQEEGFEPSKKSSIIGLNKVLDIKLTSF